MDSGGSLPPSLLIRLLLLCLFLLLSPCPSLQQSQDSQGSVGSSNHKKPEVKIPEIHCSRERSRAAAKVIDEYLMPFVEKENYQLPNKCRLHPEGNLYKDQEDHKVHVDIHEWRCGYCRKTFYEEQYLDKHFDSRHFDLVNAKRRSISYIVVCVFVLMLLPLFYIFVYLYQSGIRRGTQDLRRISHDTRKKKPS